MILFAKLALIDKNYLKDYPKAPLNNLQATR